MRKKTNTYTETKKYFCIPDDMNIMVMPNQFEEKFEDYKIDEPKENKIQQKIYEVNFQRYTNYFERLKKDKFVIAELIERKTGKINMMKINYYGIY